MESFIMHRGLLASEARAARTKAEHAFRASDVLAPVLAAIEASAALRHRGAGRARRIDPRKGVSYFTRMAKLPIITLPDPILRQTSAPIERVDAEVLRLATTCSRRCMTRRASGLRRSRSGCRGGSWCWTVRARVRSLNRGVDQPEILQLGPQTKVYEEGCLSIPDFRVDIERPADLRLRYLDREGKIQEHDAGGLLATAIQHELDHLDGKLTSTFCRG